MLAMIKLVVIVMIMIIRMRMSMMMKTHETGKAHSQPSKYWLNALCISTVVLSKMVCENFFTF